MQNVISKGREKLASIATLTRGCSLTLNRRDTVYGSQTPLHVEVFTSRPPSHRPPPCHSPPAISTSSRFGFSSRSTQSSSLNPPSYTPPHMPFQHPPTLESLPTTCSPAGRNPTTSTLAIPPLPRAIAQPPRPNSRRLQHTSNSRQHAPCSHHA